MLDSSIKTLEDLVTSFGDPALASGEFGKGVQTGLSMAAQKLKEAHHEIYHSETQYRKEEIEKWTTKFNDLTKQVSDLTTQNQDLQKQVVDLQSQLGVTTKSTKSKDKDKDATV